MLNNCGTGLQWQMGFRGQGLKKNSMNEDCSFCRDNLYFTKISFELF